MSAPVHVTISRATTITGSVLSEDEMGTRATGYTVRTIIGSPTDAVPQGFGATLECDHEDECFAVRWLASSLAGVVLPARREEIDLGPASWKGRRSGTRYLIRLVGIIGPSELRVVGRHGFSDPNTYCLPEVAPPSRYRSDGRPELYETEIDRFGHFERCALPPEIRARVEAFYEAAKDALGSAPVEPTVPFAIGGHCVVKEAR